MLALGGGTKDNRLGGCARHGTAPGSDWTGGMFVSKVTILGRHVTLRPMAVVAFTQLSRP